jgi:TonB family protein
MRSFRRLALAALLPLAACASSSTKQASAPATHAPPTASGDVYDFSRVTVGPQLINRPAVLQAIDRNFPQVLREAGTEGTVTVQVRVGVDGKPSSVLVVRTTNPAFDTAALAVARVMRFTPGRNEAGSRTRTGDDADYVRPPVSTEAQKRVRSARLHVSTLPLRISSIMPQLNRFAASLVLLASCAPGAAPATGGRATAAVDTSRTYDIMEVDVKPEMNNNAAMRRLLQQRLRTARVTGTAICEFVVERDGSTSSVRVSSSSNHAEIDSAGVQVYRAARWTPGTVSGIPVRVRARLPFVYGPG